MNDQKRTKFAFTVAMVLHVAILAMPTSWRRPTLEPGLGGQPDPIVVNLNPGEAPLRLIDNTVPAQRAVDPDTDLIAEQDSNASDAQDEQGERLAPRFDEPSEHDQVAVPPAVPVQAEVTLPAMPESASSVAGEASEQEAEEAGAETAELAAPGPAEESGPAQLARAGPLPMPEPPMEPREAAGRIDGGVKGKGFIGFEAKQHEFAPYLKEVRRAVEKRWKALVSIRYSGSSPTEAVISCAISPTGGLAYIEVTEAGDSATFAALCKDAIETAAPFRPFPFKVPRVYRTENLEIRWTFSFLQK